jgi:hypothetical protein
MRAVKDARREDLILRLSNRAFPISDYLFPVSTFYGRSESTFAQGREASRASGHSAHRGQKERNLRSTLDLMAEEWIQNGELLGTLTDPSSRCQGRKQENGSSEHFTQLRSLNYPDRIGLRSRSYYRRSPAKPAEFDYGDTTLLLLLVVRAWKIHMMHSHSPYITSTRTSTRPLLAW